MTDKIKGLIDNLKHAPGVYLMHDKNDVVIYIGKAKDLYKRVSQYFIKPQSGKVFKMVSNVDYFETIITKNEKEALILEMNLIHKYYPRYNILLKDGSHYPYIAIKKSGDVTIQIKRNKKDNKYLYFGPFPNSTGAYQMVSLLEKIFPVRKCKKIPTKECLYYHLGQCLAPCINQISDDEYKKMREEIISFLNGDNDKAYQNIKSKMLYYSEREMYETANEYKKILQSIEHINIKQNVELKDNKDVDIFAYSSRNGYISITVLIYRNGIMIGKENHIVEEFLSLEETVMQFINELYTNINPPKEIVINSTEIISSLEEVFDVNFIFAHKGKLFDLVLTSKTNADNALDEYFLVNKKDEDKIALLEELGQILSIETPYYIELFDNSHTQGSFPVGVSVAFVNGNRCPSLYRKYNIESKESRDDVSSMKEVVNRHFSRLISLEKRLPDLLLIDGGLTQTKAVSNIIQSFNVKTKVFGLYKNDKHQTEGIVDTDGKKFIIENKNLFFLLTRMQDEVHRFAITFHKNKRNKAMTISLFDNVKGLGRKRQEILLNHYQDLSLLKEASLEELSQILPLNVASELYLKLHQ